MSARYCHRLSQQTHIDLADWVTCVWSLKIVVWIRISWADWQLVPVKGKVKNTVVSKCENGSGQETKKG